MPTQQQADLVKVTVEQAAEDSVEMLKIIGINPQVFARIALNAALTTPAILDCTPQSIRLAVLKCAQRGVLPDGEQAAIVPYKGKAGLQMGYKGMADVARRAIKGLVLRTQVVVKGDEFEYEDGLKPILRHKPAEDRARPTEQNVTHAYAVAWMPNNPQAEFVVMTKADVEYIRNTYASNTSKAWANEWAEQAKKTALRRLGKQLPIRSGLMSFEDDSETEFPDDPNQPTAQPQTEEQRAAAAKPAGSGTATPAGPAKPANAAQPAGPAPAAAPAAPAPEPAAPQPQAAEQAPAAPAAGDEGFNF